MKWLYLQDLVPHIGGLLVQGKDNPLIKNVVTKRYKVGSHTLLFDLYTKGKINSKLFEKYKPIIVVTEKPKEFSHLCDVVVVKVEDVDKAYWKFVDYYRSLFNIPIIGVTGTCGKTTTKEMIKHILENQFKVQSTYKSFNGGHRNHRYLLGIDEKTGAAVIEMGVDYPGDIIFYIKYFLPNIRIVLNIDVYHLVGCKTPERYLEAKAEILHELDPVNGTLILNADDENIKKIDVSKFSNVILYFGLNEGCHFQAKNVTYGKEGMEFTLHHQNQTYPVLVPGYGKHNVYNALAAIAATWRAGIDIKKACERLTSFNQVIEHFEFRSGLSGCTVIDDTWNVTPLSMANALQVMKEIAGSKKKIALLGHMPQLGDGAYAKQEYARMGEKAIETKVDILIVVGEEAKEIGRKAIELGMDPSKVYYTETGTEIYQIVHPLLNVEAIVLLKIPHRVMVQDTFKELKEKIIVS